jgi:hypothetical protein
MEVLTTEPHLTNLESSSSEFIVMLAKLCLKSGDNFMGGDSLVREKSHDHPLIRLHHKRTLNGFSRLDWKNNFFKNDTLESNLIYWTLRQLDSVEIYGYERRASHLRAWGWRLYLLTRRNDRRALTHDVRVRKEVLDTNERITFQFLEKRSQ